jgi:hypothetical protein
MTAARSHPSGKPVARRARSEMDLSSAGGGTALVVMYLGLIPGFLPSLALLVVAIAVIVLPLVLLGLAAALVLGVPYGLWRLATVRWRRTRQHQTAARVTAQCDMPTGYAGPASPMQTASRQEV